MQALTPATDTDRIAEYALKLMDIDSDQLGIPETDYDARVTMPSSEFGRIVKDLSTLGESVRIEVTKEGIRFVSEGEAANGSVLLKHNEAVGEKKGKGKKVKKEESDDEKEDEDEDEEKEKEDDEEDEDEDGEKKSKKKAKNAKKDKKKVKKEKGAEEDGDVEMDGEDEDEQEYQNDDDGEEEQDDEEAGSSKKRKRAPGKVRSTLSHTFLSHS